MDKADTRLGKPSMMLARLVTYWRAHGSAVRNWQKLSVSLHGPYCNQACQAAPRQIGREPVETIGGGMMTRQLLMDKATVSAPPTEPLSQYRGRGLMILPH